MRSQSQTGIASDVSVSARALFRFFNSINLFLPSDDRVHDFSDRLTKYWIAEYVNWFKQMSVAFISERLSSSVPVLNVRSAGSLLRYYDNSVENILSYGQNSGFVLSVGLSAIDFQENENTFTKLCVRNTIKYLNVFIPLKIDEEFVLKLIELSDLYGFYLTLNIPLEMTRTKLFFLEQLGGQNLQIIVRNDEYSPVAMANYHYCATSCIPRFIISINEDGCIFPCDALIGVEKANLGTIYSPFSDTAFLDKNLFLDLENLAFQGPDFSDLQNLKEIISDSSSLSIFPWVCNVHRIVLENDR